MRFRITSTEKLRFGCNGGPSTNPGCIVTKSISFSFENLQAASSAKVFESAYQFWKKIRDIYTIMKKEKGDAIIRNILHKRKR